MSLLLMVFVFDARRVGATGRCPLSRTSLAVFHPSWPACRQSSSCCYSCGNLVLRVRPLCCCKDALLSVQTPPTKWWLALLGETRW